VRRKKKNLRRAGLHNDRFPGLNAKTCHGIFIAKKISSKKVIPVGMGGPLRHFCPNSADFWPKTYLKPKKSAFSADPNCLQMTLSSPSRHHAIGGLEPESVYGPGGQSPDEGGE
jgi:hypothetical protein